MKKIIIVPEISKKIFPAMSEKARARLQILDGQRRVKLAKNQGYKVQTIRIFIGTNLHPHYQQLKLI